MQIVTKKIHNGLQGATGDLTEAEREAYLGTSRRNAGLLVGNTTSCFSTTRSRRAFCRFEKKAAPDGSGGSRPSGSPQS
jgi:hypothetical protein